MSENIIGSLFTIPRHFGYLPYAIYMVPVHQHPEDRELYYWLPVGDALARAGAYDVLADPIPLTEEERQDMEMRCRTVERLRSGRPLKRIESWPPLTLFCGSGFWATQEEIVAIGCAQRGGQLSDSTVARAREKLAAMVGMGELHVTAEELAVDDDPIYAEAFSAGQYVIGTLDYWLHGGYEERDTQ